MFNKFYNRVDIRASLVAESGLYIGAGENNLSPNAIQGALLRNSYGRPYIPGSSIRGVLRSFLESLPSDDGKSDCYMGEQCAKFVRDIALRNGVRKELEDVMKAKEINKDIDRVFAEEVASRSCMACRLFGSQVLSGKVKIADANLKPEVEVLKSEVRTGNAIDRDSHTAVSGALFDTEIIPAGTPFDFRIVAENLTEKEASCLSRLIVYFAEGNILLGGRSRSGLGKVELTDLRLTISKMGEAEDGLSFPEENSIGQIETEKLPGKLKEELAGSTMEDVVSILLKNGK